MELMLSLTYAHQVQWLQRHRPSHQLLTEVHQQSQKVGAPLPHNDFVPGYNTATHWVYWWVQYCHTLGLSLGATVPYTGFVPGC